MKNNTSANISVFNEKKYKNAKVIPLGQPKPSDKNKGKLNYESNFI